MKQLAIFISHPIQYSAPLYQLLAQQADLRVRVYFYSRFGVEKYFDQQFGREIQWDLPLLKGYLSVFLRNFSLFKGFGFFSFINWGIIRELYRNKFDAVLLSSWSYFSDWLALIGALLTRTPILLRTESPANQEKLKPGWKIFLKKLFLGRLLFPWVKGFLYIGQENKKFYQAYGVAEKKLFSTPYCVENERFVRAAQELKARQTELKRQLGIAGEKTVILFGGKLIPKKRPLDLLRAFELIRLESKALVFLGDGALRQEIEAQAKSKNLSDVRITGFINQQEIAKFYALADVFVLPSGAGETWGLMVNEAMNFSLPIVVSNLVGCGPDLVQPGKNGYIFPLGDVARLAGHLEELLRDKEKRKDFGQESSLLIRQYSYQAAVQGIRQALQA